MRFGGWGLGPLQGPFALWSLRAGAAAKCVWPCALWSLDVGAGCLLLPDAYGCTRFGAVLVTVQGAVLKYLLLGQALIRH